MQPIVAALQKIIKDVYDVDADIVLTRPDEQFGDYTTNIAMQLAGKLGKPPRDVAQKLADALMASAQSDIKTVAIAGPGFINMTLSDGALLRHVDAAPHHKPTIYKGQVVVAEYSDPNPFKELHAGHLYTTLVGDVVASLFELSGATVHRVNYGGDVGLHVAKAMWGILQELGGEHPEKLAAVPATERPAWLSKLYVRGSAAYESDEKARADITAINARVYDVHQNNDHQSLFAHIYWTCRQWSYDGFDVLYKKLGVHPFERYIPESETTPLGVETVAKGLAGGVFEKSDGAVVFRGEAHGLHTRVFINSNGLPTYEAKDLGLAELKWRDYKFDKNFIITGNDIIDYMKVVLKALEHFHPGVAERTMHVTHGMIRLPGGKKMSSRKGNNPKAADILEAASAANKHARGSDDPHVSVGAVKYAFLKHRIGGDMVYDPEESVSLEGNSGPYLQYAHARARSILAKAGDQPASLAHSLDPHERSLARKLTEYPEVIERITQELMPHHLCTYLYELTQQFNSFYEHNRVLGDSRQAERLHLVAVYADILRDGLGLLKIPAPERL